MVETSNLNIQYSFIKLQHNNIFGYFSQCATPVRPFLRKAGAFWGRFGCAV